MGCLVLPSILLSWEVHYGCICFYLITNLLQPKCTYSFEDHLFIKPSNLFENCTGLPGRKYIITYLLLLYFPRRALSKRILETLGRLQIYSLTHLFFGEALRARR